MHLCVCVFFSLSLTLSRPRNCSLEDPMLEDGSSSQPKQKFERKQRRKQRRRDVRGRRKRSRITRLSRLLLLPAVQWHPTMPLGPPRLPPKKIASHDPDAAKLQDPACRKNPHEEHTTTLLLLLPSPQCRLLISTFPNASATLLPAATCTLITSFPD